jgi:DUF1365 family protein
MVAQNLKLVDYPYVYLVTAPRVLGYKFSPASFWFLYTADGGLGTMIAEVNNRFDERRMYVRFQGSGTADVKANLPMTVPKTDGFQSFWPKDFHVSPFSSRKGFYHLSARSPLVRMPARDSNDIPAHPRLDIRPVLYSSKGHKKIVARCGL